MSAGHRAKEVHLARIQCVWGLLCSLSSIDQARNNASLFNVIDQINIPRSVFESHTDGKPFFVTMQHELFLLWRRVLSLEVSDEELVTDLKIKLIDPTGAILQEALVPLRFQGGIRRNRFRVEMGGLNITIPGDYVYRIEIRQPDEDTFESVKEVPFEVKAQTT